MFTRKGSGQGIIFPLTTKKMKQAEGKGPQPL